LRLPVEHHRRETFHGVAEEASFRAVGIQQRNTVPHYRYPTA
jgi:hypothetical protein